MNYQSPEREKVQERHINSAYDARGGGSDLYLKDNVNNQEWLKRKDFEEEYLKNQLNEFKAVV